jgi:hypothetical protein
MRKQSYFTKIRRFRLKQEAVKLKGGKCKQCGWTGNIAAFQFHHRDPSKKEFGISNGYTTNWEKYWLEVEKCDLLCANCHMIIHSENSDETFLQDVEKYTGRDLISSDILWKNQTHTPTIYSRDCPVCKNKFNTSRKTKYLCSNKCSGNFKRKCVRPSKEEFMKLMDEMSITNIAKKYGVSNGAINKWRKSMLL